MHAPRLSIGLGSFLVALALVAAVGIGSAIAVIPNNGTYSACLTKSTGAIKVINYPKKECAKGQRLIKWSQQGPSGPQGPQGPAGPADWNAIPNKPAGFADGVDDAGVTAIKVTKVFGNQLFLGPGQSGVSTADCPAGSVVSGGGVEMGAGGAAPVITIEGMTATDADTWKAAGKNYTSGTETRSIQAIALCMSLQPSGALSIAKRGAQHANATKALKKRGRSR